LRRPDESRVAPADLAGNARVVVLRGLRRAPPQLLRAVEQKAVAEEEDRRRLGRRKHAAQRALEQQPEDAGRDRADDEQPAELRVHIAGFDAAIAERAPESLEDPPPVPPEEAEEHERRREMRRDEKRDEELSF
jgi:hypothetical protein